MAECSTLGEAWELYDQRMTRSVPRVTTLMLLTGALTAFVAAVTCFAPRYRHRPFLRLLFLAANALFLAIISLVAGTMGDDHLFPTAVKNAARDCTMSAHMLLVLLWTGLVLDIGIGTSTVVVGTAREAKVDLPISLVFKAVWLAYLVMSNLSFRTSAVGSQFIWSNHYLRLDILILVTLFTKLIFKYSMLYVAKRSLSLGRNPRFIAGYVAQVHPAAAATAGHPPPLVVRGEDDVQVVETAAGYQTTSSERLVTVDRIWCHLDRLKPSSSSQEQKDLCFSFALFKLLRCRFAGYSVTEAGVLETHRFLHETYIRGVPSCSRLFQLVEDGLTFIHDYYYTSIPLAYSHYGLATASVVLSLCSIGYSLYLVALIAAAMGRTRHLTVLCSCMDTASNLYRTKRTVITLADATPLFLAIAVLVLRESAQLVFCVCSNWTKVALMCSNYTHRASWRRHLAPHRCIQFLFKHCRLNSLRATWDQTIQQCSISVPVVPRSKLSTGYYLIRSFLGMGDQSKTTVSPQMKDAIFTAIQRLSTNNQDAPGPWVVPQPLSPVDGSSSIAETTAHAVLSWHVATSLLDFHHHGPSGVAPALSRYCAYLVACHPELVPGDHEWCRNMYSDAKKEAHRLQGSNAQALTESNNRALKDGAALAQALIASQVTWEATATFWSDF